MKLFATIAAAVAFMFAAFSAQAAEMPENRLSAQTKSGLAIPGNVLGKAEVKKTIVLAQRRRRRGRGAIAASEAARAEESRENRWRRRCNRLRRQCRNGNDWACDRWEDRC
jgi:hypothetical protein